MANDAKHKDYAKDATLMDAELSSAGVQQCYDSDTYTELARYEIVRVIVSPMRRAMQTAYHLLKDRPDFNEIQFVVHPVCREHLHQAGDVP